MQQCVPVQVRPRVPPGLSVRNALSWWCGGVPCGPALRVSGVNDVLRGLDLDTGARLTVEPLCSVVLAQVFESNAQPWKFFSGNDRHQLQKRPLVSATIVMRIVTQVISYRQTVFVCLSERPAQIRMGCLCLCTCAGSVRRGGPIGRWAGACDLFAVLVAVDYAAKTQVLFWRCI